MEMQPAQVMTREEVKNLVQEVLEQCGPAGCPPTPERPPKEGNDLTISIFSELQYALRSRNLSSNVPVQPTLPAAIDKYGKLTFQKALPGYAVKAIIVYSIPHSPVTFPVTGGTKPELPLPVGESGYDFDYVVAVQIQDCDEKIRLVTFPTHEQRDLGGCCCEKEKGGSGGEVHVHSTSTEPQ